MFHPPARLPSLSHPLSLSLFDSRVLRSYVLHLYMRGTRIFPCMYMCVCVCVCVQIANPRFRPPKSSGLQRLRIRRRSYNPAHDSTLVVRMFGLSFGFVRRHDFRGRGGKWGREGVAAGAGGDLLPAYGGVRRRHDARSPMNGLMERAGRATQRARLTKRASSPQTLLSPSPHPARLLRLLG